MNKCSCYNEEKRFVDYTPLGTQQFKTVGRCLGTKECEECSCGGDEAKCNFYPEKRAKALSNQVKEYNWHRIFNDFLVQITSITNGKQQYFEQEDGKWYSRISGEYLTVEEMIDEYLADIKTLLL